MTSSNVSNLLIQVSGINVEMPDAKMEVPKDNRSFEKTLQNAATAPTVQSADANKLNQQSDKKTFEVTKNQINASKESKVTKTEDDPKESVEKVIDKVNEVADKVKNVIEEELDVSEEDIENAMETLGLTVIDLLNPQSLAELVATLTGEQDSIALVMSDQFKGILDQVTELTNQLFEETGFSFAELKDLVLSTDVKENQNVDFTNVIADNQQEISNETVKPVEVLTEDKFIVKEEQVQVKPQEAQPVAVDSTEESTDTVQVVNKNQAETNGETDNQSESFEGTADNKLFKQASVKDSEPIIRNDVNVMNQPRFELQFSAEEQIVSLPSGETVTSEEIVNQLVEQARILNDAESTTMEITLNPEGLGKIFMEVTQKGDEITAKIFTENDAVKQALESQMASLRLEMNQSSSKVTSIEVSVGTHEFERNLEDDARNSERRDEQTNQSSSKRSNRINLNSLDDLSGLMSDEDLLIAQMMKDNGNSLDFQA